MQRESDAGIEAGSWMDACPPCCLSLQRHQEGNLPKGRGVPPHGAHSVAFGHRLSVEKEVLCNPLAAALGKEPFQAIVS